MINNNYDMKNISIKNCFGVISIIFVICVIFPMILWSQCSKSDISSKRRIFNTQEEEGSLLILSSLHEDNGKV